MLSSSSPTHSNLPPSPALSPAVSGAAQIMGDLVTGRVAETKGQSLSIPFDEHDGVGKFSYIIDVLRWRAQTSPENQLFSVVDSKVYTIHDGTRQASDPQTACVSNPSGGNTHDLSSAHVYVPDLLWRDCGSVHA